MTKELLAEVKQGLQRLQDELNKGHTRAFLEYLQTLGRFHQYSFHNSILIWLQKPDATLVAGFRRWQELGRWVRRGSHQEVCPPPPSQKAGGPPLPPPPGGGRGGGPHGLVASGGASRPALHHARPP